VAGGAGVGQEVLIEPQAVGEVPERGLEPGGQADEVDQVRGEVVAVRDVGGLMGEDEAEGGEVVGQGRGDQDRGATEEAGKQERAADAEADEQSGGSGGEVGPEGDD
jgi:hypothetical protein